MAFERPTLAELVDRIQSDFVSRLNLTGAILRRSMVYVLSRVLAGAAHMLHGRLDYLARQLFADQSDEAYLLRQGALFGIVRNAATFATGLTTIAGTNGTVIPAGTLLRRSDGAEYVTAADVTISAGTASAMVTAKVAGDVGNCSSGTVISLESPISGATSDTTTGVLSGGTDVESVEEYRTRVVARMQAPPHGGNDTDYIAWAKEVAGVTRAWVYPRELGAGTVVVRFMRDDDSGSAIPDAGEVTAVQSHIDSVRPVTAIVTVSAPTGIALNFTFSSITPATTAVKAAVAAELADLILRDAIPGGTIPLSAIRTAIGIADGLTDYVLTSPAADVTRSTGQITTMGTVTWP